VTTQIFFEVAAGCKECKNVFFGNTVRKGVIVMSVSGVGQSMSMLSMLQMKPPSASDMANKIIGDLDTNGDGALSTDEISAGGEQAQKILSADSDGDGNVTLDELLADISKNQQNIGGMQPPSAEDMANSIIEEFDTDGDGVLSTDEISASGEHAQDILGADADGDGTVTMDELVIDISEHQPMGGMQPPSVEDIASGIIDELDTDGDSALSTDEISASGESSTTIQAADANEDGTVTMEELIAYLSEKYGESQTMMDEQSSSLSLVA